MSNNSDKSLKKSTCNNQAGSSYGLKYRKILKLKSLFKFKNDLIYKSK